MVSSKISSVLRALVAQHRRITASKFSDHAGHNNKKTSKFSTGIAAVLHQNDELYEFSINLNAVISIEVKQACKRRYVLVFNFYIISRGQV